MKINPYSGFDFTTTCLIAIMLFYSFVIQVPVIIIISFLYLLCIAIWTLLIRPPVFEKNFVVVVFIFSLVMLPGLFKVEGSSSAWFYFFSEILIVFLSWHATRSPEFFFKSIKLTFFTFLIFIYIALYFYWGESEPFSHILDSSSQNGVPSYLLVIFGAYLFCSLLLRDEMPIWSAVLVFFVCFFGEGRGSMLISIALLMLCFIYGVFKKGSLSTLRGSVSCGIVLLVVIVMLFNFDILVNYVVTGTKLSVGLNDSHRINIFYSYLSSLSLTGFFLGSTYEGTIIHSVYNDNPHISYVRLHSLFGVIALFSVFLSPFIILGRRFSIKMLFLFLLLWLLLSRALSEPILFPTYLDYFYISLFFIFFRFKQLSLYCSEVK